MEKKETIKQEPITVEEIGKRIKDVRTYLLMTQQQVADITGLTVFVISKIETGKATMGEPFIRLLDFCSNYISLDFLFTKDFSIGDADNYVKSFSLNSVVKARIDMIRLEANSSLEKTRKLLEQQLNDTASLL
jgi:transcriptional regulator with XRE-family HTH domain